MQQLPPQSKERQTAQALAAIFKDEKFKKLLDTIKDGLGSVLGDLQVDFDPARFQSLPTTFEDLETAAESAQDSVDDLTEKTQRPNKKQQLLTCLTTWYLH